MADDQTSGFRPPDGSGQPTPGNSSPSRPAEAPAGLGARFKSAAHWFSPPAPAETTRNSSNTREILETVVFVVVLVLLLKAFAAEAFVIPTGSMATTLWGYQKYVTCPECGYGFPVNCSDEVERTPKLEITRAVCPNCRYLVDLTNFKSPPSCSTGDRVLVAKSLYDLGLLPTNRLDVVVFRYPKYPQSNYVATNYIKRLIGLPGETIGIWYGKLYVRPAPKDGKPRYNDPPFFPGAHDPDKVKQEAFGQPGREPDMGESMGLEGPNRTRPEESGPPWSVAYDNQVHAFMHTDEDKTDLQEGKGFGMVQKPTPQMLAMRRIVYDNDHPARDLTDPAFDRWVPEGAHTGWAENKDARAFSHTGGAGDKVEYLRYRHVHRDCIKDSSGHPRPELITDFIGYNTQNGGGMPRVNWVGDLMLECDVQVEQAQGELVLELSKGTDRFRARWDLASGECTLLRLPDNRLDKEEQLGRQPTTLSKPGTYRVRFANIDQRLVVWVDRKLPFGEGVGYKAPAERGPQNNDLQPASIGSRGAALHVRKLTLWRDTYYTLNPGKADATSLENTSSGEEVHQILSTPSRWEDLRTLDAKTLYVQPDYFLCMGDNSPASSDGRSWGLVPRRLLLGRALWVYYPFWFPVWPLNNEVNRFGPIK
jgi:signal peptidase I